MPTEPGSRGRWGVTAAWNELSCGHRGFAQHGPTPRGLCPVCREYQEVVQFHPEHMPAGQRILRSLIVLTVLGLVVVAIIAVSGWFERGGREDKVDYACINAVGWLLDPEGRQQYFAEVAQLYEKASDEGATFASDLYSELLVWYSDGNEVAVQGFVDVNGCFDRQALGGSGVP